MSQQTAADCSLHAALLARRVYVYPATETYPLRERLRRALLDNHLETARFTREETFEAAYQRIYGESLTTTKGI